MFFGCTSFNQPLDKWNVSNVREMANMFKGCTSFNQPLNTWTLFSSNNGKNKFTKLELRDMLFRGMFSEFTERELQDMYSRFTELEVQGMFSGCSSFNQPLDNWDLNNVRVTISMFENCTSFNQSLNKWNVSNIRSMNRMFYQCTSFNQPLDKWDVSETKRMNRIFYGCKNFNQSLENWDVRGFSRFVYHTDDKSIDDDRDRNYYYLYEDDIPDNIAVGILNECTSFTQHVETWKNWKGKFDEETLDMIRSNRQRIKNIRDGNINNLQRFTSDLQQAEQRRLQGITIQGTPVQFTNAKQRVLADEGLMRGEIAKWFGGRKKTKRSKKQGKTTHKKTKRNKKQGKATHKKRRTKQKR